MRARERERERESARADALSLLDTNMYFTPAASNASSFPEPSSAAYLRWRCSDVSSASSFAELSSAAYLRHDGIAMALSWRYHGDEGCVIVCVCVCV